ncbi:MAG: PilZ domain-containing protein [Gammaproteobacteria bacterium]|nr:PilZ domain-containing protein [Gammaproteobacteria bacterium]
MTEDHRLFTRIPFEASANIISTTEGRWQCQLIDISLKGVLVSKPDGWDAALDDPYLLELDLDNNDIKICMQVSVAHIENKHVGFRCEHIDIDSISHLRRLVELNVGDTEILNRELSALGH